MSYAEAGRAVTREALIEVFSTALACEGAVLAAWLGGSDANGRADALSDVDLCVIAPDEQVEGAFDAVERAIESVSAIARRYRLPSPTWHGAEQAFYRLADAPEWLMVDLCVFARSREHQFFDRSRHGEPVVLVDPLGLVRAVDAAPGAADGEAQRGEMQRRIAELEARFEMFAHMPVKEAQRGRAVDALHFYHGLVLRPLVELLRIRHCPERHDFALRYLDEDLPREVSERVRRLAFVAEAGEIPGRVEEARGLFRATLAGLEAGA